MGSQVSISTQLRLPSTQAAAVVAREVERRNVPNKKTTKNSQNNISIDTLANLIYVVQFG